MSPEGAIICAKCGTQLPASAQFCNRCGAAVSQAAMTPTAVAAPAAPVISAAPAPAPVMATAPAVPAPAGYAGFWLRFGAAMIDGMIVQVAAIPLSFMAGVVVGVAGAGTGADQTALQIVAAFLGGFIGLAVSWLYFAILESSAKQSTWGKRALGVYVSDLQGRRISFARASGRYFSKFISMATLFIGYIMAGYTEKKQALHDMVAGTLVLRRA